MIKLSWEPRAKETHRIKTLGRFGRDPDEALQWVVANGQKAWLGPNDAPSANRSLALVIKTPLGHVLIPVFFPGITTASHALAWCAKNLFTRGAIALSVFVASCPPGGGSWDSWKARALRVDLK